MTWLAWRQFRTSMASVAGAVAILAVVLLVTRPGLLDVYRSSGLADCTGSCVDQIENFVARTSGTAFELLYAAGLAAVYLTPAVIGLFWGAPMVARELESGTYRLVGSQSITRSRWLGVKLAAGAAVAMAIAGLLSLVVAWWSAPLDRAGGDRLIPQVFGARGAVPIAYAALAFVLGVLIGTVLRRTVAAMALSLVLVAAVQIVMPLFVREHLITPKTYTGAITVESGFQEFLINQDDSISVTPKLDMPGAWVLRNEALTAAGKVFTGPVDRASCGRDGGPRECEQWVAAQNLHQNAVYQPASRFWPLQWIESALILAVTGVLTALCFWWVRRRLS